MFIADFHIHSKYSRATSSECVPDMLELWARRKGLSLIGTGDFTHPVWRQELKDKLSPSEEGLYTLKDEYRREDVIAAEKPRPRFIISGEISSIYKKNGKVRKVHNLIVLPSLEDAETLSHRLEAIGNLHSDGRPILGLDSKDLLEITLEVCPEAIFIPAHIWTPHFSVFGAYSGFDTIEECFGDLTGYIHALETGLSSDPPMNWRLSALDKYTLVSNSDAHSPGNLAREANLFATDLTYPHISRALQDRSSNEFSGTIEFFPEEGKYHYDGHRNCKVCLKPSDTIDAAGICPVCGDKITVGVLHRVEALADRPEGFVPPEHKHFESLIPLHEVIAASIGLTAASNKVREKYSDLIHNLGPELFILRESPLEDIGQKAGPLVAEGIRRLRSRKVEVLPGYDGEYGRVKILNKDDIGRLAGQLGFLSDKENKPKQHRGKPKKAAPEAVAEPGAQYSLLAENKAVAPAVTVSALDGLNQEQLEAVTASDAVIAVIAGPGTGKTRTLVSRAAYLIQKCGIPPSRITAVTFTNRAADEMRARLVKTLGNNQAVKDLAIGTFHSICLQILSAQNTGSPVTVIDEHDSLSIIEDILKSQRLKNSPRNVLRGISLIKSGVQPSAEKMDIPAGILDLYNTQLKQYSVLDYDDILLDTLKLMEDRNTGSPEDTALRERFSYLLVDEFQDINLTQYKLIREWGQGSAGIFVIGDPNQAIYGFRGSDSHCFDRLAEDYPNLRQIRLTQNYRSTPEIVGSAQSLIYGQNSKASLEAKRESGAKVQLLDVKDEFSEALFVAKEINRLVGGIDMLDAHKTPDKSEKSPSLAKASAFSDIAVLYRTNHQAKMLEECFQKEGIPYSVAGRDDFLFEHEVRKTVVFFRFLLNPADLISLGICLKEMDICRGETLHKVITDYSLSEKSIAALTAILKNHLSDESVKFTESITKYSTLVRREKPQNLIESWMNDNGLKEIPGLELLLNTAVLYDDMPSFLQNLLLGRESDIVRSGRRSYTPDAVSLLTLHAAKGLEFPVVFLCGIKEGTIPLQNRGGDFDLAEERRLFYVGMTRAQDELILLASSPRSSFLADISRDSLFTGTAFEPRKAPEAKQLKFF